MIRLLRKLQLELLYKAHSMMHRIYMKSSTFELNYLKSIYDRYQIDRTFKLYHPVMSVNSFVIRRFNNVARTTSRFLASQVQSTAKLVLGN